MTGLGRAVALKPDNPGQPIREHHLQVNGLSLPLGHMDHKTFQIVGDLYLA